MLPPFVATITKYIYYSAVTTPITTTATNTSATSDYNSYYRYTIIIIFKADSDNDCYRSMQILWCVQLILRLMISWER